MMNQNTMKEDDDVECRNEEGTTLIPREETVPSEVTFEREKRPFTDIPWGILYFLSYVAYLACGFYMVVKSKPRYTLGDSGMKYVSNRFLADAENCCGDVAADKNFIEGGYIGSMCSHLPNNQYGGEEDSQSLIDETSKFDADDGIFDAFLNAPDIIAGLLGIAFGMALIWVLLLRYMSRPIVILTEFVKVGVFVAMGVLQEGIAIKSVCFVIAAVFLFFMWYMRKNLMFCGRMISHSTIAMKENPIMFAGCLFIKLFYVLNACFFIMFFSESFDVLEVSKVQICYTGNEGNTCRGVCEFTSPNYVTGMSIFIGLSYIWTVLLFSMMRLSVISTIVGSWHFHPDNRPGVITAIRNTIIPSLGTLSISSLIATVAERMNRTINQPCWRSWVSPFACITGPLSLIFFCLGSCCSTLITPLTKYAVILHVFTGLSCWKSAKKVFKIMSRHFKNGFVTDYSSRIVLELGSYVFSIGISILAWRWMDIRFDTSTMPGGEHATYWYWYFIGILVCIWFPVVAIYVIIIVNRILRNFEKKKMTNLEQCNESIYGCGITNDYWIPPLAGMFIGCISMMFFLYLAAIFLDTIDTLFLCYSIDKDNAVNVTDSAFEKLIEDMPDYIEATNVEVVEDNQNSPPSNHIVMGKEVTEDDDDMIEYTMSPAVKCY